MLWVSETGAFTVSSVHGVHTGRDMIVRYAELLPPVDLQQSRWWPAGRLLGWLTRPDGSCYHV